MDTKKCELCGTILEVKVGDERLQFMRHSDEWCRAATLWRIAELERAAKVGAVEQRLFHEASGRLAAVYREACELHRRFIIDLQQHEQQFLEDLGPLFAAVHAARDGTTPRERTPPPPTSIPGPGVRVGG